MKYSFLKELEKMFLTHKNGLKFYGLNAIWVKRRVPVFCSKKSSITKESFGSMPLAGNQCRPPLLRG